MLLADKWKDYKIIDAGDGEKLERVGNFLISRPDSQIIWNKQKDKWENLDAIYHRSDKGGGYWEYINKPKENFIIKYQDLSFYIEFTNFKHIGLFPEQAINWQFIIDKIKEKKSKINSNKEIKALNLFAYTGGATVSCAYAGCDEVVHVDASKKIVGHAKRNIELNKLKNKKVRFIIEDVIQFVLREARRGRKYDIISIEQLEKFQERLYSQEAVVPEPPQTPQPSSTFDYAQMTRQQRRAYERRLAKKNKRKY